ncbi:MAG: hypothetical protein OEL76_15550 [Siculibacillus sp.]|nr:hypothetical protein [Siculibacillus sp.]
MTDTAAPPRATPARDLDHREVFARFVDRLVIRLPRPGAGRPSVRTP